jgi:hypothetical protein
MKKTRPALCTGLCLSVIALAVFPGIGYAPVWAQTSPASGNAVSKDACLECHGPFDKLAGVQAGYVAPSGEKINPHVYVPHTSREAKAVPECTNCHRPHGVPPKAGEIAALPKPDTQWCYTTCHHNNNFESCKHCHK